MGVPGGISAKDVCALLKACAGIGVKEISFTADRVDVSFFEPRLESVQSSQLSTAENQILERELLSQLRVPLSDLDDSAEVEAIARDEQEIREEQLAMLAVTDPVAYEDATVRDEFEDQPVSA